MPVVANYLAVTAICWLVMFAGILIATTGQWFVDFFTARAARKGK